MIRIIVLLVIFWQPVPAFSLSILSLPTDGEGRELCAPERSEWGGRGQRCLP